MRDESFQVFYRERKDLRAVQRNGEEVLMRHLPEPSWDELPTRVSYVPGDIEQFIIEQASEADGVLASVAWITRSAIIDVMNNMGVPFSIILQKTENERTYDIVEGNWAGPHISPGELSFFWKSQKNEPMRRFSYCGYNEKAMAILSYGRFHPKSVIFLKRQNGLLHPRGVLSSSFNWTANAKMSFDDGMYVESGVIGLAALQEFWHRYAISENPLSFSSDDPSPDEEFYPESVSPIEDLSVPGPICHASRAENFHKLANNPIAASRSRECSWGESSHLCSMCSNTMCDEHHCITYSGQKVCLICAR